MSVRENVVLECELWDGRTLVIDVTDEDPGDHGEPRSLDAEGKTFLAVRAAYPGPAAARSTPVPASNEPLDPVEAAPERLDVDWLANEVVAYFKVFDYHEVWKPSGARALGEWLALHSAPHAVSDQPHDLSQPDATEEAGLDVEVPPFDQWRDPVTPESLPDEPRDA